MNVVSDRAECAAPAVRHDWTREEIGSFFAMPLLDLVFDAASVHRRFHDPRQVQVCKLISIKTGGCPEDCGYCSQSAHHQTSVKATPLMEEQDVVEIARRAKAAGASRVCMGAAWRQVRDNQQFEHVLEMVRQVSAMGLEVCCTLGMLTADQARRLEAAGLHAYNHNLDTSREHYPNIVSTRTFDDRLDTIAAVRQTSVTVCCGGIIGLGESEADRISLLQTLSNLDPHPESVPINVLSKVEGTPLQSAADVPVTDTIRMIAAARILMPRSIVRLSAGRAKLSASDQALCFLAGANSIFSSETGQMLTRAVPSPDYDADRAMLSELGMTMRPPLQEACGAHSERA